MSKFKYGWKPDRPDHRDLKFSGVPERGKLKTVALFDNYNIPPIYNQGNLGSCTGNAGAGILQFELMNKSSVPNPNAELFYPSRLYIYWWERFLEGSVDYDSGATIRDCIKVLNAYGACSEKKLPYNIADFRVKPSDECIAQAKNFEIESYRRIDNRNKRNLVAALNLGKPIIFGFTVYESFESDEVAATGIVPMPGSDERVLGGHAVCIMAYNALGDYFVVRNSWGKNWGINGYCHMPAAYITNDDLATDFWIIDFKKSKS